MAETWKDQDNSVGVLRIFVSNAGPDPIAAPWQLTVNNSDYLGVKSSWNWDLPTVQNGHLTGSVTGTWATLQPHLGNIVNVGVVVMGRSSSLLPQGVAVNGVSCTDTGLAQVKPQL